MLALLAALLPLTALAQTRYNTFVQCVNDVQNAQTLPGTEPSPQSAVACASQCASYLPDTTHSYYAVDFDICFCSAEGPRSSDTSPSNPNSDVCTAGIFSAYRLRTTYRFRGCELVTNTPSLPPPVSTTTLDACFTLCRFSRGTLASPVGVAGSESYDCRCLPTEPPVGSQSCQRGAASYYAFSHDYTAASGGFTRKRAVKRRVGEEYCPAGLTACKIRGSEDGYECIDTKSELESCGGCVYGQYGIHSKSSSRGVNCAALDGEKMGSMTCRAGQCVRSFS